MVCCSLSRAIHSLPHSIIPGRRRGRPRRAPPPGHADLVGVPRSDRTCAPQPTPPSPLFTASSTVEAAARRCCKRSEARHFFRIVEICMNNICALRY
jgi:hypothetical protein